jgi:hypothetical protein
MIYKDWTIVVTNIEDRKDGKVAYVDITLGQRTETKVFTGLVSKEGLAAAVKGWIDTIATKDALSTEVVLNFAEVTPVAPIPTPAELARTEYEADRARLANLMELVRDGAVPDNDTRVTALQAKVRNALKPEYLG